MTHWICPKRIDRNLRWPEKANLLFFFEEGGYLSPFPQHSSARFIREILNDTPMEETTAYRRMSADQKKQSHIWKDGKRMQIRLDKHENMVAYFDKCQALIQSVRQHGVKCIEPHQEISDGNWHRDKNIGVAITDEGEIAHFRRGHHRLAIAQSLALKSVPVDVLLISAKFIRRSVPLWRLRSNSTMVRAIDDLIYHLMRRRHNLEET
jgi:hypothetical protein